jgi:hypothetical protein
VVRAFHDFLADNAHKLAQDDDALLQGAGSPALERYREERALMARLDRLEREGQLLPRDEMRVALGRIAAIVRGPGYAAATVRPSGRRHLAQLWKTRDGRSSGPSEGKSWSASGPPVLTQQTDLQWFLAEARPRRLRTMRQFAEEEIIIPDGPFVGRKFRCSRGLYRTWFDAVDSGQWNRLVATGPTQSGKTLSAFIIPLLYHLFELGETVICGLPDMDMAADKWREDILPVIEQSRYRELLPRRGGGSRGGRVESIQLRNGATLKYMSGGGRDKSRAGYTSRVVVITETDGMDEPGQTSREADKITQLRPDPRLRQPQARVHGMHGQHRAGSDLAGIHTGNPEPDRAAMPRLPCLGQPRARAPDRLARG